MVPGEQGPGAVWWRLAPWKLLGWPAAELAELEPALPCLAMELLLASVAGGRGQRTLGQKAWRGEEGLATDELSLLGYTPGERLERMPPAGEGPRLAGWARRRPGAWMYREEKFGRLSKLSVFCCLFRAATSTDLPRDPVSPRRAAFRTRVFPPRVGVSPAFSPLALPFPAALPLLLLPLPCPPRARGPESLAPHHQVEPSPPRRDCAQAPCSARRLTEPPEEVRPGPAGRRWRGHRRGWRQGSAGCGPCRYRWRSGCPTWWLPKIAVVFPVLLEPGSSSLNPSFYLSAGDRRLRGGVERVKKEGGEGRRSSWLRVVRPVSGTSGRASQGASHLGLPTKPPPSRRECVGCAHAGRGPGFSCIAQFTGLLTLVL